MRLMLVDDHTVVRAGLRAVFERQPDMTVVAETDSAAAAMALVGRNQPDVLLLDLTLAGGGSMELVKTLQTQNAPVRVLVLTMHDDPAYAKAALAAGATGYVVKTISEQDLLTAVRAVHRGQVFVDLDDKDLTANVFAASAGGRWTDKAIAGLSARELDVLRGLGRGYTNQQIAEHLDISPKTVATYRARVAEKLGLKSTADFVRYASDTGLLDRADPRS